MPSSIPVNIPNSLMRSAFCDEYRCRGSVEYTSPQEDLPKGYVARRVVLNVLTNIPPLQGGRGVGKPGRLARVNRRAIRGRADDMLPNAGLPNTPQEVLRWAELRLPGKRAPG